MLYKVNKSYFFQLLYFQFSTVWRVFVVHAAKWETQAWATVVYAAKWETQAWSTAGTRRQIENPSVSHRWYMLSNGKPKLELPVVHADIKC